MLLISPVLAAFSVTLNLTEVPVFAKKTLVFGVTVSKPEPVSIS